MGGFGDLHDSVFLLSTVIHGFGVIGVRVRSKAVFGKCVGIGVMDSTSSCLPMQ